MRDRKVGFGFVERHPTDPFPAVSKTANSLDVVWTSVGGWEEVPECVRIFSKIGNLLSGKEGNSWVLGMGESHFVTEGDAGAPCGSRACHALAGCKA
jgi:hypothetical protein